MNVLPDSRSFLLRDPGGSFWSIPQGDHKLSHVDPEVSNAIPLQSSAGFS